MLKIAHSYLRFQKILNFIPKNQKPISKSERYFKISAKGKKLLLDSQSFNKKYSRGGIFGEGLVGVEEVLEHFKGLYTKDAYQELLTHSKAIQTRMRVKVSESYLNHARKLPEHAKKPHPILDIVLPKFVEILDLSGETDPSNQNKYSPISGLLHKYEMALVMNSINCSSHCRYCYRLDLFNGISGKEKADMEEIANYISLYNEKIFHFSKEESELKDGLLFHKSSQEPLLPIREVLFSGGDPMTLPNATLLRYMILMAESGVTTIRIGTKELVFNPSRFDKDFFKTIDQFHLVYPSVRLEIMGHYTHPFELLVPKIDSNGLYDYKLTSGYEEAVREDIQTPIQEINLRRSWIGHWNQFPIIAGINDSPEILRLLFFTMNRLGINAHNVYACREIPGSAHFRKGNTIIKQFETVQRAKIGLSGIENHPRLILSTEWGKMEVISVENHKIYLRLSRYIHGKNQDNTLIVIDERKLGDSFYWLNKNVWEKGCILGKEIVENLEKENGFIKNLKTAVSEEVKRKLEVKRNTHGSLSVKGKDGLFFQIQVSDDQKTISEALKKSQLVEAICGHKTSCTTCAAVVEDKTSTLPKPTPDEQDLLDTLIELPKGKENLVRLTCQISSQYVENLKIELIPPASLEKNELNVKPIDDYFDTVSSQ